MKTSVILVSIAATTMFMVSGCGGSSSSPGADVPAIPATGSISVSITDDPWHEAQAMVLHITGMDVGHANGDVTHFDMPGGSISVDMMQLQNGVAQELMSGMEIPAGQYDWMRLQLDLGQSYMDDMGTGGRHSFQMGPNAANGLEVHEPFQIQQGLHSEFMLDFDVRQGVQHRHMGMMGDQYELHSALRLVHMNDAGGLSGMVDPALIDINHPDCDPVDGGNWVYIFPGDATAPDDIAETETDGVPGPIAADRVDMDPATGEHGYHFGFLPAGSYRVAFTCSGKWDEAGDDDYPTDPDGLFDFQMFSDPIDIIAGQMHRQDL